MTERSGADGGAAMGSRRVSTASRVALVYATVTATWVILSDRIVGQLGGVSLVTLIQTVKGWLVVAVTACLFYILLRRDQAERNALARELEEARAALREQTDGLPAVLGALSHELRTPLTSVLGMSQTLHRQMDRLEPVQAKALAARLTDGARTLRTIIESFDREEQIIHEASSGERSPVEILASIRSVVNEAGSGHEIELGDDEFHAHVNEGHFRLLVEQLLLNAVTHTPAGTKVWVRARRDDRGFLLSVDDDGPGVPGHLKEHLFRPFEQHSVPGHQPVVGIGLAIVERLATLHGGRAWVEDRPGGGASFRVSFPQRSH